MSVHSVPNIRNRAAGGTFSGSIHAVASHSISVEDFETEALPYLNDIFRTASRITGDRSSAQDLVQDVYLQAWKSFDRFQLGTNCRAWLFKILFNKLHHYHRARYNSKLVKDAEEFLREVAAYEPPVPEQIRDEEVLMALDKIPADYREVILLADVQEFAYKEIAEILGIPIGTVMSRISRGRKLLRIELADIARGYGIRNMKEGGR
ncbi:MAG TPA: sigma-70 family RNA polymerase sigma factor [Candidatus Kapabacteria bacterium]|nr:sigma-70 family RNA polymerase sigma factor [Candidatus Kapabacteria bacterium]